MTRFMKSSRSMEEAMANLAITDQKVHADVESIAALLNLKRLNRNDNLWQSSVETKAYQVKAIGTSSSEKSLNAMSGIYSLLVKEEFIPWYRIADSANVFIWQAGTSAILVHELTDCGGHLLHRLGNPLEEPEAKFLIEFPGSSWFAMELVDKRGYALHHCLAAPGFTWEKLDCPKTDDLVTKFPKKALEILKFPREEDLTDDQCKLDYPA